MFILVNKAVYNNIYRASIALRGKNLGQMPVGSKTRVETIAPTGANDRITLLANAFGN